MSGNLSNQMTMKILSLSGYTTKNRHLLANSTNHWVIKFTFDNDNNKTYFEYNDPKSVDELLERMGTNTKIIEALKYGPLTPKELESKGIKNPRTALSRLKRKGIIIPIGKEAYGLVDNEQDPES